MVVRDDVKEDRTAPGLCGVSVYKAKQLHRDAPTPVIPEMVKLIIMRGRVINLSETMYESTLLN